MKALIVSLLFAVVHAKFHCESGAFNCYFPEEVPKGIPKDVADFDRKCSLIVKQADCMSDLVDECGNIFRDVYEDGYLRNVKDNVHKVCDKDSELYQALAKDITCMHNAVKNVETSCDQLGKATIDKAKKEKGFELYEWNKFMCTGYIVENACKVGKIQESCGDAAETAILTIFKYFKGQNGICMEDSYDDAVSLIESLTLDPELKSRIAKYLKRIA